MARSKRDPKKENTAKILAQAHYRVEPGISRIFRIVGPKTVEAQPSEPVKLLEINEDTLPLGIRPIGFDAVPAMGIDWPSVIVEVTPDEFSEIEQGRLPLPPGWQIEGEIPRERNAADQ